MGDGNIDAAAVLADKFHSPLRLGRYHYRPDLVARDVLKALEHFRICRVDMASVLRPFLVSGNKRAFHI